MIVGVFIKKDNSYSKKSTEIKNRAVPIINTEEELQRYLELAVKTENDLAEKVKTEGRNYSR